METNIFSIEKHKKLKELKNKELQFKAYLNNLKHEQLQYEANHIINKINEDNLSDEFLLKSSLLMEELAKRVDANQMANTINKFSSNIRSRIDSDLTQ